MELEFDPDFPVRVTSGSQDNHPTAVQTARSLIACLWERNGEMWRSFSTDRGYTWAPDAKIMDQTPIFSPRAHVNDRNGFALVWGNPTSQRDIWFEEINESMNISDHLMEVRIQRSYGTTSKGVEFRILNPDRLYDPEKPGTAWTGVFLPGAQIIIKLGYGGENKTRFTGYIDDIESEDRTGYLTVSARGDFKYILDQHIRRKLTYTNKKRTTHMAEMAVEAGIDGDKIDIQDDPLTFTEEFDRTRTYMDIINGHAEALGFEIVEPDEGGLISRDPVLSATPVWFYEEDLNMYARTRSWDDDDVPALVTAYREPVMNEDGTSVKVAGAEWTAGVPTNFLVPPRKTEFIEMGPGTTELECVRAAQAAAVYYSRQGSEVEVVGPLNVALEVGDTINIRRESWNQSGAYVVEFLDDDCKKNLGTSRELAGTERGGQFAPGQGGGGGFANIIRARKVLL